MHAVLTKPNAPAALGACCVRDEVLIAPSEAAFVDHKGLRQVMRPQLWMLPLEGSIRESDELQEWVTIYLEIYLKSFHLRWPILHAPTLGMELRAMFLPLTASICVIGAWFQGSAKWTDRFYVLRVHEILLQRLLHRLVRFQPLIPQS